MCVVNAEIESLFFCILLSWLFVMSNPPKCYIIAVNVICVKGINSLNCISSSGEKKTCVIYNYINYSQRSCALSSMDWENWCSILIWTDVVWNIVLFILTSWKILNIYIYIYIWLLLKSALYKSHHILFRFSICMIPSYYPRRKTKSRVHFGNGVFSVALQLRIV